MIGIKLVGELFTSHSQCRRALSLNINQINDATANICFILQSKMGCRSFCTSMAFPGLHEWVALDPRRRLFISGVFCRELYDSSALQPLTIMNYPVSGERLGLVFRVLMFSDLKYSPYHEIWSWNVRIFPLSGVTMLMNVWFCRSILASSSAWLPLLNDTVVLGVTLYRTLPSIRNRDASFVMRRLLEDGLIYYRCVELSKPLLNSHWH